MSYKSPYSNYIVDNLVKYRCKCGNEFILSQYEEKKKLDKGRYIACPYCNSKHVETMAWATNQDFLAELGCIGIGHVEGGELTNRDIKELMKHDSYCRHKGAIRRR